MEPKIEVKGNIIEHLFTGLLSHQIIFYIIAMSLALQKLLKEETIEIDIKLCWAGVKLHFFVGGMSVPFTDI